MLDLFEDYPEAVEQTNEIAVRINFSMDELAYNFPDYPVPPGETMDSSLRKSDRALGRALPSQALAAARSGHLASRKRISRDRDEKACRLFSDGFRYFRFLPE